MNGEPGRTVRIERTFAGSAEEVFDAWTSPEVMRRWFHVAADWETPVAEVDLRVGGKVRIVMRRPDGTDAVAWGEYRVIDRPRRLVMTWTFYDAPDNRQLLDVSFAESGGSTTVLLVNSDISTDDRRRNQDLGWRGCLDQLERLLTSSALDGGRTLHPILSGSSPPSRLRVIPTRKERTWRAEDQDRLR